MNLNLNLIALIFILISYVNSERKLLEEKNKDDIIIIHTNDVHCGILDNIGYDGLMLFKKELQTKYEHVILVDAGDHIQGAAIGLLSYGSDIIKIMNELEYDASTIGNHEFDYKLEQLYKLREQFNHNYVNAHFCFRKNKTTVFEPYKIVEAGNIKIGFIGVLTPLTLTKTYLHTLVDEDGNYIYDFLTERQGLEFYEAIQKYINELREIEHVDYVIILSHLGLSAEQEEYSSEALLRNIEGVDAIIDGHSHQVYSEIRKDKTGKDVIIAQVGTKLSNLGALTLSNGTVKSEIISEVPIFQGYEYYKKVTRDGKDRYVDPDMKKFLEDLINSHEEEIKEFVGYTDFDMITIDDKAGTVSRNRENNLCDLVADSIRNYYYSDIGFLNSGGVRNNIYKGNITVGDILTILPFSNKVVQLTVPGRDILDTIEYGMKNLPNNSGKFLQVSGLKFKVYDNIPSPVKVDDFDNYVKIEGERRVFDVFVGNEKLDINKNYTVSLPDFMAEGGDGYTMFTNYKVTNDSQGFISDICKNYIQKELNKRIPDIYKTNQDRIVKMQKKNNGNFLKYFGVYSVFLLCLLF